MIITVLRNKYDCGSNRGITYIEYPNLLGKLNLIINWNLSEFPKKDDSDEEDKQFLGDMPELKPGNMFVYDGQVIACDSKDRLVLVISETGALALQRIYDNTMSVEFDLRFNYDTPNIIYEKSDSANIPDTFKEFTVPYDLMMIFKNNFLIGRDFPRKDLCIKVVIDSDNYALPATVYILDWKVKYDPILIDEEQILDTVKEIFSWFYNKYEPIILPPNNIEEKTTEDETSAIPQP